MTTNLRARFCKRQHKRLSKSITIGLSSSKKARSTPSSDSSSKSTPPTHVAAIASNPNEKLSSIGNIPYHEIRKSFIISGSINEKSFECSNPSPLCPKPAYVPNREEVSKLLTSNTRHEVLFSATQQILVEVDDNLNQSFMVRLPYDTSNTAIAHIIHMKDYTTFETMEVVGHPPLFYL
ncbi:hypothetical protein PVL29_015775 [Vitis rotundifolia]|uniref:Uncharacterized protein n=1 Tax=Vitis rotundifolia TaxID=103349 RepID=A0AA38ZDK0_VITRO|nr:hypothetical protein PVL29_015775 [Vitis rotundifolia]